MSDERFHLRDVDRPRWAAVSARVLAELRRLLPDVEAVEVGSTAVDGVIGKGFLDCLRRDPGLRERYNALKRPWDGRPMADDRAAKGRFVMDALSGG